MRSPKIYLYLDGKRIAQCTPYEMPITKPLYQFKKHTIVQHHHVSYQVNYCYVCKESQVIILN